VDYLSICTAIHGGAARLSHPRPLPPQLAELHHRLSRRTDAAAAAADDDDDDDDM
jgi:hypothetical protein